MHVGPLYRRRVLPLGHVPFGPGMQRPGARGAVCPGPNPDADANSNADAAAQRRVVRDRHAVSVGQLREQHLLRVRLVPSPAALRHQRFTRYLSVAQGRRHAVQQGHRLHDPELRPEHGAVWVGKDCDADADANAARPWRFVQQLDPVPGRLRLQYRRTRVLYHEHMPVGPAVRRCRLARRLYHCSDADTDAYGDAHIHAEAGARSNL